MQIMQIYIFSGTSFHIKSELHETKKQNTARLDRLTTAISLFIFFFPENGIL